MSQRRVGKAWCAYLVDREAGTFFSGNHLNQRFRATRWLNPLRVQVSWALFHSGVDPDGIVTASWFGELFQQVLDQAGYSSRWKALSMARQRITLAQLPDYRKQPPGLLSNLTLL